MAQMYSSFEFLQRHCRPLLASTMGQSLAAVSYSFKPEANCHEALDAV